MIFVSFLYFLSILSNICLSTECYEEFYLDLPIDHFTIKQINDTFKLRYLVVDRFHVKGGPIFFYCGNEADIENYFNNSGFLLDIAPNFNALVVFAEHRYYGKSMPFGMKSLTLPKNMRFLTTSQALSDFARLIDHLGKQHYKTMITTDTYPIIAFGGSYGGMLSAWMRMKYPHLVLGAIASSAPILQINNLELCESFYQIITDTYADSNNCSVEIKASWKAIENVTNSAAGRKNVSEIFKLCKPLIGKEDVDRLVETLTDIYVNLAMMNYPYPTSFLTPLPANPVKIFCDKLKSYEAVNRTLDLLKALASALEIATNFTGKTKCNHLETTPEQPMDYAWDFQACFELVMPMCATKKTMFQYSQWSLSNFTKECTKKYGMKPFSLDTVLVEHGGKILRYASNIVFSNGLIDPWYSGGILTNVSASVVAILIPDAAHHYDLRGANPVDTKYVIDARNFHVNMIKKWLNII